MKNLIFTISFFIYSGYYAGLAIIFALNLSELSRFYSIPLRILLSILMIIVIKKNRNQLKVKKTKIFVFLFLFFWFLYFLKTLYSENVTINNQLSKDWYEFIFFALTYVILPFFTYLTLDIRKYGKTIINSLIFSGFIMGVVSTYLYGNLLITGVGRISMITYETGQDVLSPLALSYAGALTIVLAIYKLIIFKVSNIRIRIYLFSTITFGFIMFLLGSSRGSVIALALTLPLFIYYSPIKRKVALMILTAFLVPVITWLLEVSGSNIVERILNTKKDKGGGRNVLWEDAINHFLEHPIFGGRIEIGGIYPHNLVIEMLMATGLVGTIIMGVVLIKGFKLSIQLTKQNQKQLYILIILIQAFIQHSFTAGFYTSTLLFVPIAIALNIENKNSVDLI